MDDMWSACPYGTPQSPQEGDDIITALFSEIDQMDSFDCLYLWLQKAVTIESNHCDTELALVDVLQQLEQLSFGAADIKPPVEKGEVDQRLLSSVLYIQRIRIISSSIG